MSPQEQKLQEILTSSKLSITKPRLVVFNTLIKLQPCNMPTLISNTKSLVDRASVYRTVELFEKLGIVHRIAIGWKYKLELSDIFQAHHHHMVCLQCGKTIHIHGDSHIEKDISDIASKHAFVIVAHQLELQGYCKNCHTIRNEQSHSFGGATSTQHHH